MTHQPAGLHDHVATLLDAMGTDPVAVASTLRAEEIHGIRGSVLVHPVCRWLIRLVPDLGAVLGRDTVNVFRPGRGRVIHGAVVPLPDAVRAFADRFDDGEHPELELSMLPRPITPSETATPAGEADPPASTAAGVGTARRAGRGRSRGAGRAGTIRGSRRGGAGLRRPGQAGATRGGGVTRTARVRDAGGADGSRVPAQATAPTTPTGSTGSTGPTAPTGPAGSKKAKRPRKPTRPREPKETTVSSRPAGTSATTDRSPERHLGSGGPASGAEAAEAVSPPRPTVRRGQLPDRSHLATC